MDPMRAEVESEIERFVADLRALRIAAGDPSPERVRRLASRMIANPVGTSTLKRANSEQRLPSLATVTTYIMGCRAAADKDGLPIDETQFSVEIWHERWKKLRAMQEQDLRTPAAQIPSPSPKSSEGNSGVTSAACLDRAPMWLPNLIDMTYLLMLDSSRSSRVRTKGVRSLDARLEQVAVLGNTIVVKGRLDDANEIAALLTELRIAGAHDHIAALLSLDIDLMAKVSVEDEWGIRTLLEELGIVAEKLGEVRANQQAAALAVRIAGICQFDDLYLLHDLLNALRKVDAHNQIAAILERNPAMTVPADDGFYVAKLLKQFWEIGAHEQAMTLADRSVIGVEFDDQGEGVAALVRVLLDIGAEYKATQLAIRPEFLEDPDDVANLLWCLREVDATNQVSALISMDVAAKISLDRGVSELVRSYCEAGAIQQATTLANRATANGDERILKQLEIFTSKEQESQLSTIAAATLGSTLWNQRTLVNPSEQT